MGSTLKVQKNSLSIGSKKNKSKHHKFTPLKMIIWAFNLVVGYSFLISLIGVYNKLGGVSFILLIFGSFLAISSAFAFAKLGKKFHNDNGGILFFAKKVLNRYWAGFFGFFQVVQWPLVSSIVLIGYLWAFGSQGNGVEIKTHVYIIPICFLLFLFVSIFPWFGFTTNKFSLYFVWALKWAILIATMFLAISLLWHSDFKTFFQSNITFGKKSFNYFSLWTGLFAFYFAFAGFEAVPSMSNDIENPKKNMFRIIIVLALMIFLFYALYYVLIGGAVGVNINNSNAFLDKYKLPFHQQNDLIVNSYNPIFTIFQSFTINNLGKLQDLNSTKIGIIIVAIIIITQIANKSAGRMQQGWINTRIVYAYSKLGFMSDKFYKHKNKHGQFSYAFWFDFAVSTILSLVFLLFYILSLKFSYLSFLIYGPLALVTFTSIIQYIGAFLILVVLGHRGNKYKKNKTNIQKQKLSLNLGTAEYGWYIIMLFVCVFLFINWFASSLHDFIFSVKSDGSWDLTSYLQVIFVVGIILYAFYFTTHFHKKLNRSKTLNVIKEKNIIKKVTF